jgi:hypothetical protein
MLNKYKYVTGIASIAVVGLVVFLALKSKESRTFQKLDRIADEGYETAGDILFPLKTPRLRVSATDDNNFARRRNVNW